tara:strand:+ start:2335 stop:2586 length:252 start_codon:yes stop_codon:yes gene_type:complete
MDGKLSYPLPLVRSIAEHHWEAGVDFLMENRHMRECVVEETNFDSFCNWKFTVKITECGDIIYETSKKENDKDWVVASNNFRV